MRKVHLSFCLLFCVALHGQINSSWPDSNAIWVNTYYEIEPVGSVFWPVLKNAQNYCLRTADTSINGNHYAQIHFCGGAYKGALRKDNGRVFFVPKDSASEFLLYDFTANVGDSIYDVYIEGTMGLGGLFDFQVTQVDTVSYGGRQLRQLYVESGQYMEGPWIEGIGNIQGIFRDPFPNISGYEIKLECMSRNDTALYPQYNPRPCGLIRMDTTTANIDVYATVEDTAGNPLSNYIVHFGTGNDPSKNKVGVLGTDQQGVAHTQMNVELTNLYAYVYDCAHDSIFDYDIAVRKTAADSTHFKFIVPCAADTCEVVLSHELVNADSNEYVFRFDRVGISPTAITPMWHFSDGSMSNIPSKRIEAPGWFTYCIGLGCAPDQMTCDSLYVYPQCDAEFVLDTVNSIRYDGKIVFWKDSLPGDDYEYSWDFGDGNTSTERYPSHTYAQPGNYTICLSVSFGDGYSSCSEAFCVTENFDAGHLTFEVMNPEKIGTAEYNLAGLDLYPNPVRDKLRLQWPENLNVEKIEMYGLTGRRIGAWRSGSGSEQVIDLSEINKGIYFVKVSANRGERVFRVFVE